MVVVKGGGGGERREGLREGDGRDKKAGGRGVEREKKATMQVGEETCGCRVWATNDSSTLTCPKRRTRARTPPEGRDLRLPGLGDQRFVLGRGGELARNAQPRAISAAARRARGTRRAW